MPILEIVEGEEIGYISLLEDDNMQEFAQKLAHDLKKKLSKIEELKEE